MKEPERIFRSLNLERGEEEEAAAEVGAIFEKQMNGRQFTRHLYSLPLFFFSSTFSFSFCVMIADSTGITFG